MSVKCNIISFGKLNKYYLIIIVGSLSMLSITIIGDQSIFYTEESSHPVEYFLAYPLGLCLSFFLLLFFNIYNKRKGEKNTQLVRDLSLKGSFSIKRTSRKEQFLWILLISIMDFLGSIIYVLNFVSKRKYLNFWSVNIITFSLFSYLILKIKVYKHHYVCIAIVVIFGILFDVILDNFNQGNIISNLVNYLSEAVFSLTYVICKYIMLKKFVKSYEILSFEGLIELILGIITLIITNKIGYQKNFSDFIDKLDSKEIILYVLTIIISFIYSLSIMTIIDTISPIHVILTDILLELIKYFIDLNENDLLTSILTIIFILICLFAIFVFIEVIELNFLGLSHMTKRNIDLRSRLDTLSTDIKESDEIVTYKGYDINFNNNNDNDENENELVNLGEKHLNE